MQFHRLCTSPTKQQPEHTDYNEGDFCWSNWEEMRSGGDCHSQKSNDRGGTKQLAWTEEEEVALLQVIGEVQGRPMQLNLKRIRCYSWAWADDVAGPIKKKSEFGDDDDWPKRNREGQGWWWWSVQKWKMRKLQLMEKMVTGERERRDEENLGWGRRWKGGRRGWFTGEEIGFCLMFSWVNFTQIYNQRFNH